MPDLPINVNRVASNELEFPTEHLWFTIGQRLLRDDGVLGEVIALRVGSGGRVALTVGWDDPYRSDPRGYYYYCGPQAGSENRA